MMRSAIGVELLLVRWNVAKWICQGAVCERAEFSVHSAA